jgi:hypothetical protein
MTLQHIDFCNNYANISCFSDWFNILRINYMNTEILIPSQEFVIIIFSLCNVRNINHFVAIPIHKGLMTNTNGNFPLNGVICVCANPACITFCFVSRVIWQPLVKLIQIGFRSLWKYLVSDPFSAATCSKK